LLYADSDQCVQGHRNKLDKQDRTRVCTKINTEVKNELAFIYVDILKAEVL